MNREFQRKQREFREDLNQRRNEELSRVLERANRVIRQIAEAEKYDIIFQEAVYANPRIDITDKVIKALDDTARQEVAIGAMAVRPAQARRDRGSARRASSSATRRSRSPRSATLEAPGRRRSPSLAQPKYRAQLAATRAGAVILSARTIASRPRCRASSATIPTPISPASRALLNPAPAPVSRASTRQRSSPPDASIAASAQVERRVRGRAPAWRIGERACARRRLHRRRGRERSAPDSRLHARGDDLRRMPRDRRPRRSCTPGAVIGADGFGIAPGRRALAEDRRRSAAC